MQADRRALLSHLVAVLFVAHEPLSLDAVARVLEVERRVLEEALGRLEREPLPGLMVQRLNDQLVLSTAPGSAAYVERFLGTPEAARLSRAALEVLALVAYKQPITRAEIDAVRGVNSDSAVATLLARGLIEELGRRDSVGHPVLLGTSPEFLRLLGLASLAELPPLDGFARPAHEPSPGLPDRTPDHSEKPIDPSARPLP